MNERNGRTALLIVAVILNGSCKNNDNPGSPTPPQCRTFASQFIRQVVKPDFTTPQETSRCTFDTATATLTCSGPYMLSAGCPGTLTTAYSWASVSDFVVENGAVGKVLQTEQRETINYPSSCAGTGTLMVKMAYDASRRLTSRSNSAVGSSGYLNVVYSAWDDRGRPTGGTVTSNDHPAPCQLTESYDEQRRTYRTSVACEITGVETVSLDTNGNVVRIENTKNGIATSTETRTINSTQSVCR